MVTVTDAMMMVKHHAAIQELPSPFLLFRCSTIRVLVPDEMAIIENLAVQQVQAVSQFLLHAKQLFTMVKQHVQTTVRRVWPLGAQLYVLGDARYGHAGCAQSAHESDSFHIQVAVEPVPAGIARYGIYQADFFVVAKGVDAQIGERLHFADGLVGNHLSSRYVEKFRLGR